MKLREPKRYEITHVPAVIRNHATAIDRRREPISRSYERICFDKARVNLRGKVPAAFICPGHPLLEAVIELTLDRHRDLLKQGAILVDDNDPSEQVRSLVYLEHSIQDASTDSSGKRRIVSRRMQYVEIDADGNAQNAGDAPYLNYRSPFDTERLLVDSLVAQDWLQRDLEAEATSYAIAHLVPDHLQEARQRKEALIAKTLKAVNERLAKEILYWDTRAEALKQQEAAGKVNAKLNSAKARARADELEARLQKRKTELEQERRLSPLPPVVVGGALVVSIGLLQRLQGKRQSVPSLFAKETKRVEMLAMQAVISAERSIGHEPRDVSGQKCGYDIESRIPQTAEHPSRLRFIEVKGRIAGAETVTVTKNEILTALNQPESFILALVQVPQSEEFAEGDAFKVSAAKGRYAGERAIVRYVQQPFQKEPDFGVTSVNYNWQDLWQRGSEPQ
ncbi:DUF3883 domain-containing protein [Microcoleus sp. FACHB-1515]|uniref:DUF3883 domain-containing protein n=1 Tax=Microcoleus sp. FACHB-1515 TaxID=2692821 RepID=UPI0028C4F2AD|nr:DUF3883 domain-containing protein [Microcoleus sp. FACHB-1515]